MLKENKIKGEDQFLKMTWFDVLNNVEKKGKRQVQFLKMTRFDVQINAKTHTHKKCCFGVLKYCYSQKGIKK